MLSFDQDNLIGIDDIDLSIWLKKYEEESEDE